MKRALVLALSAGVVFAGVVFAQNKARDLCVPPPSGVAPSLPARIMEGQGRIDFPITTSNPKAQEFFNQGVAQMHSFWATEAERSFLQAAALDPDAPMPWWGVAMVSAGDYRPRFQIDRNDEIFGKGARVEPKRARAAAEKAVAMAAMGGNATDREKLYIAAVAALRLPGPSDPDAAYILGLRSIVAKYPHEVEARTYLALHLMRGFTLPDKQPRPGSMEAVSLLRQLLIDAPDHPGVHHYVIHGWEGASFAREAWPSCERYAELVPNIPHALHMPGHIYSQTGRWEDAANSFAAAADNELGYIRADPLYGTGHHGHNVHYLATAYAFEGEYEKARDAAFGLLEFRENPREASQVNGYYSAYRQGWFALLRAMVQCEKWDEILDGKTLPSYDKPRETAWRHWALGLAYAAKGRANDARTESARMEAALRDLAEKTKTAPARELRVAHNELLGQIEGASGKLDAAFRTMERASRAERALPYSEPPLYPRPISEAMGQLALRHGRLAVAENAFRTALEQYPASARSQAGLKDTLKRQNKPVAAGE